MLIKNKNIYLILLSAFTMGIAQHVSSLGFIAWVCLVPFILVIEKINSYKKIIKYFFLFGFVYHIVSLFWLSTNIGTDRLSAISSMFATILYLSTNTMIIGIIWLRIKKFIKINPVIILSIVWPSIEFIKSYGILAFPWISIANTQIKFFYLIQIAEYVGIYGITFWIILVNGYIVSLIKNKLTQKSVVLGLVGLISPFLIGYIIFLNVDEYSEDDYQISLIQPNIKLSDSRDYSKRYQLLDSLIATSSKCIKNGSDLIIWPEAALPFHTLQNKSTLGYINEKLLENNNVSILSGDITLENDKTYNSVVLFNNKGIQNVYKKRYPVPLAEQVPLSDIFPKLKKINIGVANYSTGSEDVIFNVDEKKFSSLICYESTFPGINRRHVNKGAEFITFLVNDAWYTAWPEPEQHAKQSVFRAIENRKTVLRCANTGISLVIDPTGKVRERIELNNKDVITTFIKKTDYKTFYTKFGNVFAYILLIIMMLLFVKTFKKNENES